MPNLAAFTSPLFVQRIYTHYEKSVKDWKRPHLGASLLGTECLRFLWYSFRWVQAPNFDGRMLRLFDTGNIEEGRLVRDMRNIGIEVFDADPDTGKQFSITIGNHAGGSLDGIARGFDEAPKKWHVVEFKTHGQKSFDSLQKDGVEKSKPLHFAQMQIYMYKMNQRYPGEFDRAMYIGVNKNTDEIHAERVKLDHLEAEKAISRAVIVVGSNAAPPRISDKKDSQACLFCQYHGLCWGDKWIAGDTGKWIFKPVAVGEGLEVNCRTCLHSTPSKESRDWECASSVQCDKTSRHLFIPDLLYPWGVMDASESGEWVKYDGGVNKIGGTIEKNGQN